MFTDSKLPSIGDHFVTMGEVETVEETIKARALAGGSTLCIRLKMPEKTAAEAGTPGEFECFGFG